MQAPPPMPQDPYRTPDASVADFQEQGVRDPAIRWLRLAAILIDACIGLAVIVPLMFVGGY